MSVFAKLNLKDQTQILVIDAPASFEPELQALEGIGICAIRRLRQAWRSRWLS